MTTGCFDKGGISRYNRYQITALREILGDKNVKVFSLSPPREGDFEDSFDSFSILPSNFQMFKTPKYFGTFSFETSYIHV